MSDTEKNVSKGNKSEIFFSMVLTKLDFMEHLLEDLVDSEIFTVMEMDKILDSAAKELHLVHGK
mgnify:CR=1 FL=1